MSDDQDSFDFEPPEPKFGKGEMIVKISPDHFTANGVRFNRPDGMGDKALTEACQPNVNCFYCRKVMAINFGLKISKAMLVGLYALYHRQKRQGGFQKYANTNEIVERQTKSFGANVRTVVSKNKHFGLLEKMQGPRPGDKKPNKEGSGKTGRYRMTERGRLFVENRLAIQFHCATYRDENLNCFGKKQFVSEMDLKNFNWKEAFYGAPPKT